MSENRIDFDHQYVGVTLGCNNDLFPVVRVSLIQKTDPDNTLGMGGQGEIDLEDFLRSAGHFITSQYIARNYISALEIALSVVKARLGDMVTDDIREMIQEQEEE